MFIDCWDNYCYLLWSFKWLATPYHEDLENLLVFFRQSSLHISFEQHQTRFMYHHFDQCRFFYSSLNLPFIELSTQDVCFFLAHINLIFFGLCVSANFFFSLFSMEITFLYGNHISFILTIVINIGSDFSPFVFHLFCTFFIFKKYYF